MRTTFQASALKTAALLAAALTAGLMTRSAYAIDRDPNSFVWIFSDTQQPSQDSALGMSRGLAWPVIFGANETFALRPTSGGFGGFWQSIGPGVGNNPKAASSPSGSVAGAGDQNAFIVGATGVLSFLPSGTNSVDFTSGGAVVYSNNQGPGNSVTGFAYNGPPNVQDVAV